MKLSVAGGVVTGPGSVRPGAEEIYSALFEGRSGGLDADSLRATALDFSREPASPALLLTAETGQVIRCRLAGRIGDETVAAGIKDGTPADYIISAGVWYPLPPGTTDRFRELVGSDEPADLTIAQYLSLTQSARDFHIDDRAAAEVAAPRLAGSLGGSLPSGLIAQLYRYQETGIRWLGFLARHGVGCILADEMGLGKTLQVIGTLLGESASGRRPNLVVCPATLLENWKREIHRFAPSLTVGVHAGSRRTGRTEELAAPAVVVASYETVAGDISLFRAIAWNLVVLDEAQAIRNPEARRTMRCKELPRRAGIAVTGTPVENRLLDLWSITDFAIPGYLGSRSEFERAHAEDEEGARGLEPLVSALMLRRRVADVAGDLPPRIDVPVPLVMDDVSVTAYDEIREEALRASPRAGDLTALVRLRMFCTHPWAAGKFQDTTDAAACSAKLERCLQILEEIFAGGEKALVFTSFNEAADIIERAVGIRFRVPTAQINGSVPVPERQPLVDAFTSADGPAALVLNPRAAGTGLNITAANHVIHYNLEWNPAVEDQASARSYRRGQTRPVTVHRLFYADTVEEVIADRMARKRAVADSAVVGASGTEEDLADFVRALQRSPRRSQ
jgi:SNF2 family DNA or RNA helicase